MHEKKLNAVKLISRKTNLELNNSVNEKSIKCTFTAFFTQIISLGPSGLHKQLNNYRCSVNKNIRYCKQF